MIDDLRPIGLTPDMMVSAEILTGKRRVISYVLSPLSKATHEAGRGAVVEYPIEKFTNSIAAGETNMEVKMKKTDVELEKIVEYLSTNFGEDWKTFQNCISAGGLDEESAGSLVLALVRHLMAGGYASKLSDGSKLVLDIYVYLGQKQ